MNNEASGSARVVLELQQLAHTLSRTEQSVTRRLARLLEDDGCSIEQWRALLLLSDGSGHSMSELANRMLLPPATLTRLIDRMVALNLAYRKADTVDRRRVLVYATARGTTLHRKVSRRIKRTQDEVLDALPEAELVELIDVLTGLMDRRVAQRDD